jgi:hypothetical protein
VLVHQGRPLEVLEELLAIPEFADVPDAKTEFWIAIAGPITSALIGIACLGINRMLGWLPGKAPANPAVAVLLWLGYINLVLAAFNLIPGFPLDGGRVLRAAIWWITHNADRSMRLAAQVGKIVALAFIVLGLMRFFVGASFGGLWTAFIGWFLLDASRASYARTELISELLDRQVGQMMKCDYSTVDGKMSLQRFVDQHLLPTGFRCFIVEDDGHVTGLITPNEVKGVERSLWPSTTVDRAMRPLRELHIVTPDHLCNELRLHPKQTNKPKIDFFVSILREFPRAKCEHFCSDRFNPDLLSSN